MDNTADVIRFNDVAAVYAEQRKEIDAAIAAVLRRGDFINGVEVKLFEEAFASFCGAGHCIGTASGTASIGAALNAVGLEPGAEVITTPMTFIATAEAITHAGGRVVFSDINPDTLNLDPQQAESRITERTQAVVFVHLHGNPAGILESDELARRRGLILIEDCAQSHGAFLLEQGHHRHSGTLGAAGAFSFFPGKNLGAFGDAGALITNDPAIAERSRKFVNHGRLTKYCHEFEGYNFRLDTLQAAVLLAKLSRLEEQVERRNRIAARYEERLAGCGDLRFQKLTAPGRHARHLFVVQTARRKELQQRLRERGVETGIHYPIALHLQPAYSHLGYKPGAFPVAERLADSTLSLPLYAQLPLDQVDKVCDAVLEFLGVGG